MLQAHWFTALPARQVEPCTGWGCRNQAFWMVEKSPVALCDGCLYHILEDVNNDPDFASEELAPSFFDYVRGMLPRHMASCGYCLSLCSVQSTLECLLENGLLAPFIDHHFITSASIEQIVAEYWEVFLAHYQA